MSIWQLPIWFGWLLAAMVGMIVLAAGWLGGAASAPGRTMNDRKWVWGTVVGVPLLAVVLYARLGHPVAANPALRQHENAAQTMVDKLAAKLQSAPGDLPAWIMLARSYKVLGKLSDADQAYARAQDLVMTQTDDLTDWIQVRVDLSRGQFDGQTQRLLAQAVRLSPDHDSVLLFRGLMAIDQGDYAQAIQHMQALQGRYEAGSADHEALTQVLVQLKAGQDPRRKQQVK